MYQNQKLLIPAKTLLQGSQGFQLFSSVFNLNVGTMGNDKVGKEGTENLQLNNSKVLFSLIKNFMGKIITSNY